MKIIKILIVLLILTTGLVLSQQNLDDLQKVKDALVNMVLYSQALEKQNADLTKTVNKIAEDLKNINTVEQLDSLKIVYGLKNQIKKNDGSTTKIR